MYESVVKQWLFEGRQATGRSHAHLFAVLSVSRALMEVTGFLNTSVMINPTIGRVATAKACAKKF